MKFHGIYLPHKDPLVVSAFAGIHEQRAIDKIKQPAEVLYHPPWHWSLRSIPWAVKQILCQSQTKKTPHFICSASDEFRLFSKLRLACALSSTCSYIDPSQFNISGSAKIYDAIYSAQMVHFKRLELAAKVQNLFVLTYGNTKNAAGEFDLHQFAPQIAHCQFNRTFIDRDQVSTLINQARVGLALSSCEGAMLASVEYLLCGLPVVSTRSLGGRDEFYDPRYVKIVDDNPEAVAKAVRELISQEIDPRFIREETLTKLQVHRVNFCKYVAKLLEKRTSVAPSWEALYQDFYQGPMGMQRHYLHRDKLVNALG